MGHGRHMATMPLGAKARLDAGAKTLEVIEPAVGAGEATKGTQE
jgi:muramoyltetrapeptide carboxypeptidase LdcA involved in peptidoglycan recycling